MMRDPNPEGIDGISIVGGVFCMIETVLSVVQSASGEGVLTRILSMNSAEWAAFRNHRAAARFFHDVPRQIAAWTARLQQLKRAGDLLYLKDMARLYSGNFAYQSAVAKLAAEEALITHSARIAAANAAATAAEGTLVAGAGTTAAAVIVPVVALVAVGLALGAPYYEAREKAKKDEYASGFAKGFITGLLKWELRFTIDRFWDNAVGRNGFDHSMPAIKAAAHNTGLIEGRLAGLAKDDSEKKNYLRALRMMTKTSTAGWTSRSHDWMEQMRARQVQISYVIDLMGAAVRSGMITQRT